MYFAIERTNSGILAFVCFSRHFCYCQIHWHLSERLPVLLIHLLLHLTHTKNDRINAERRNESIMPDITIPLADTRYCFHEISHL